jgi:membrane protease subunit HflK
MADVLPQAKALYIVDSDQKTLLPLLRLESGQVPAAATGPGRTGAAAANATGVQP